jgi:DNA-binding FrmR family transcriptional regulator
MSRTNDEGSASRPLRDKRGLVNRVRRLRGQVDAIERALAGEASCSDLLQRITAARGAINGLMAEVLEEHVREYLLPPDSEAGSREADAAEELNRDHPFLSYVGMRVTACCLQNAIQATKSAMVDRRLSN